MIEEFVSAQHLPGFRVNQFNHAMYVELISSFDELTTWPIQLREQLKEDVPFCSLTLVRQISSERGDTVKYLFSRSDGTTIETVLMKHRDGRNTICVSCMVGCPVNCTFCATGKMGFIGNLTTTEIVDQVLCIARLLQKEQQSVTNIVFMGMGEPMLNLASVMGAIAVFTDPKKMNMSDRRITVSTSGYIPQMKQFFASGYKGKLAVSLHAPNNEIRKKIMPIATVFDYNELIAVTKAFSEQSKRRVSFEYILIAGVNDQVEHAKELASHLAHWLCHVNLIPYNTTPGVSFSRPDRETMNRFSDALTSYGIENTLRVTMGDDIKAACGQLAGS